MADPSREEESKTENYSSLEGPSDPPLPGEVPETENPLDVSRRKLPPIRGVRHTSGGM
jgi:hypothetical protein